MGFMDKFFKKSNGVAAQSSAANSETTPQPGEAKIDVNQPVENPKLKSLFAQWRQAQTNDLLNQVFEELVLRGHFLSVVTFSAEPTPSDNGTAVFQKGAVMSLPMLTTQEGESFYPAFTDWEELKKWSALTAPPKTLVLSFDDYAGMVLGKEGASGVVINPFSDNFLLNYQTLAHLKTQKDLRTKGVSKQVATKNETVQLGTPKEFPTVMVEVISDYLKTQPVARRAWLRLMIRNNEQSYLLVLDFPGDQDTVFGNVAAVARPYLKNMYIDMVPYEDDFGKNAVEGVAPFYEKGVLPAQ